MSIAGDRPGEFTIIFDDVNVVVDKRVVVDKASGFVGSGRLTAIVSCCGARGDFHLLSALAGVQEATGTVVANGTPVVAPSFRSRSAFIDDDMALLENLTVQQNIEFSASMRLGGSSVTRSDAVSRVMEQLALVGVKEKEVAHCSLHVRRRVAVAKELVLNPASIFLDNPMQGLATHDARQLLVTLQAVATNGTRAFVISMVQPRWALLDLVDDVILMEGANVVFVGKTQRLLETVALGPEYTPDTTINAIYRTATSPDASLVDAFGKSGLPHEVRIEVTHLLQRCAAGHMSFNLTGAARTAPSAFLKFFQLIKHSCIEVRNNVVLYSFLTALLLVVAIVLAAIYNSQSGQSGMQNRVGIIFFLISSTLLHNILMVDTHKRNYLSFQRHRLQGYYGPLTFLTFHIITSAFVRFFMSSLFTVVVYSLANIESRWDMTSLRDLVSIVALTSFSTSLVVYLVCAIVPTTRLAHFALFAVYTFNIILAGIILNINTLPRPLQVLSLGSHVRLGYESALVSQFEGRDFGCGASVLDSNTTACYTGDQYMLFLGFREERKWKNVHVMLTMSAISITLIYMVMLFFRPKKTL